MAMGVPQKRWMVFVKKNVNLKWMRTRGTPMAVEHPSVFCWENHGTSWIIASFGEVLAAGNWWFSLERGVSLEDPWFHHVVMLQPISFTQIFQRVFAAIKLPGLSHIEIICTDGWRYPMCSIYFLKKMDDTDDTSMLAGSLEKTAVAKEALDRRVKSLTPRLGGQPSGSLRLRGSSHLVCIGG